MPHPRPLRATLLLLLVPAVLSGCQSATKPASDPEAAPGLEEESEAPPRRDLDYELVEGEPMYDVLPLDGIPAIDTPEFVSAAEASFVGLVGYHATIAWSGGAVSAATNAVTLTLVL